MTNRVDVCIPNTKRDFFTYECGDLTPAIGARVQVPFRNKSSVGIIVSIAKTTAETCSYPLKSITQVIDKVSWLSEAFLDLCQWVSRYYQSPLSEVLALALPKQYRQGCMMTAPMIDYYQLISCAKEARELVNKRAIKQHQLIDFFDQHPHRNFNQQQLRAAGFDKSTLKALLTKNIIQNQPQALVCAVREGAGNELPLLLNDEQMRAVAHIIEHLDGSHRFLLHGVTGSGKTEVYLQVIREVLEKQRQVLIIVPEIGLTPQLVSRFTARFSEPIVVIHSSLSEGERQLAWYQTHKGEARIVIGTRTAIFTPMPKLGLIVIDEEHDASLKQQDGVRYSARDTALVRAQKSGIPIILGSATPSLESVYNAQQGKYSLLSLNQQAITTIPLQWTVTDLRSVQLQQGLAPATVKRIEEHLQKNNQVLVFINRRGFSPVLLCHQCGWIADCPHCDSHFTLHRLSNRVICHHCGKNDRPPNRCQKCQSTELIPVGTGTQRLEESLQAQFPDVVLTRIDRDEIRKKHELETRLEQINQGQVQLIIGTQMMAKGHHFPKLTLVVVVDADCGLYNQDFRAIEHLGQLITQVAGRAGRAEQPGEVMIQTHFPNHPLLNTLIQHGYTPFTQELLKTRAKALLPPYCFLAVLRAQSQHAKNVFSFLHKIKGELEQKSASFTGLSFYGPASAPMARKANQHRMQLLLKSTSRQQLQMVLTHLRHWIGSNKLDAGIRWHVDVDPIDLS